MIKHVAKCRICDLPNIQPFLDLGSMPLPNGFLKVGQLKTKEPLFPLEVGVCTKCWLMQLTSIIDPQIMFKNYAYIPSTSKTRLQNFAEIVSEMVTLKPLQKDAFAVDIGSNDGSLLLEFKKQHATTLGVDLAENLAKIAELKGIPTLNTSFNRRTAKEIRIHFGYASYITATNVVAHIHDLHDFFNGVELLLDHKGIFVCEFPYIVDLLEKCLFDTIYQEHLSYFGVGPICQIIDKHQLKIIRIKRTPIDGGALRLSITKKEAPYFEDRIGLRELQRLEKNLKLDTLSPYLRFAQRVSRYRKKLRKVLKHLKLKHKAIAGYGAAARGNILMNFCHIGQKEIDFIVDSTPYKQGLFTPGNHIPVFSEDEILKQKPDYVLILAWNFAKEIIQKQKQYKKQGGKFIIPQFDKMQII